MSISIDLFEERLDELEWLLAVEPLTFVQDELYPLYTRYQKMDGDLEALAAELQNLSSFVFLPTSYAWGLIDSWADELFLPMDISATNRCRDLLLGIYADFENSALFEQLCARFELERYALLEVVGADILQDWFLLWIGKELPHTSRLLLGEKRLIPFQELLELELEQVVDYLPRFVLWGLRPNLSSLPKRQFIRQLAEGQSLRKMEQQPVPFSKRMAHAFAEAPKELHLSDAIWYSVLVGFQGDLRLLPALKQFFGRRCPDFRLLQPLVQFFTKVDRQIPYRQMRALLGYLQHRFDEDGALVISDWTLATLRRRSDQWYAELATRARERERQRLIEQGRIERWEPQAYRPFDHTVNGVRYQIIELHTMQALEEEGRLMRHCVGSYYPQCIRGGCSIWALRAVTRKGIERLVTIEVTAGGRIVQVRQALNAQPTPLQLKLVESWAQLAGLKCGWLKK